MNNDNIVLHRHNFYYVETVEATCMVNGYDLYKCECGCEEVMNFVEATAKHIYKEVDRSEATKADEGFIKYQCKNCIDTYIETLEFVSPTTPQKPIVKKPSKVTKLVVKNKRRKKMVVSWKRKKNVAGFQIQYAQNRKFTKKKKSKMVGKGTYQKTITKLKKGKTYYVRIRAYKKSSGKKIYGKWSKIRKIKIRR